MEFVFIIDHLPLICKPNLTPLDECLVCELKIGNKKCFITVLYRSPSQSLEEFERFKNGWVNTISNINNSNPFLTMFLGDFNARNTLWWSGDIINSEGLELNELSSYYNLHQLINSPTHILPILNHVSDVSRAILTPVYRYGRPNSGAQKKVF